MRFCQNLVLTGVLAVLSPASAGTPSQADAVRTAYEKSTEAWRIKMQLAESAEARAQLVEDRPKAEEAARQMWAVIGNDLEEPWTLGPAAWFLRIAANLVSQTEEGGRSRTMATEIARVRQAVATHHLESPELAPLCLALVSCADPPSLKLLREIEEKNPDEQVSGVAALGIAMMLKDAGDDEGRLIQERLKMLRKAIIHSADVEINDVKVADLAEEELYIINNLSKGLPAPALSGKDSGGRPLSLADYEDQVIMLIFWKPGSAETDGMLDWVERIRRDERFRDAPFEVVGVCVGPRERLRALQRDDEIVWPNFSDPEGELAKVYRVGSWPLAYVLGPGREIHYVGSISTFAELTAAAVLSDL